MVNETALILLEGLPGAGKSTTAQWLAIQAERAGRRARWVYEQETPHPVFAGMPQEFDSTEEYVADQVGRWSAFAERMRESGTLAIVDSAFLQRPVFARARALIGPGGDAV